MSFKNILVAVDESAQASAALDLAIDLAKAVGAALTIVHAVDPALVASVAVDAAAAAATMEIEMDELQAAGKELLEGAVAHARAAGLSATSTLLDGVPAPAILETARRAGCDLIAIGTHGRHGLARVFLGSCAEAVVRESTVPVLIKRS